LAALPPATPVLEDVDTLIMSPALFAQHPIRVPADVEVHALLAGETRPGDWIDWLEAAGQSHLVARPRRVFDHFFITRQVVEDGLGLGIGEIQNVARELFKFGRDRIGADQMGEIISGTPGLSQFA